MPEDPPSPPAPHESTLARIADHLKDQPPLLYGLGAAIVLAGAAAWGLEAQRALTVPLLVVLLAALAAWVLVERRGGRAGSRSGGVSGGLAGRGDQESGDVAVENGGDGSAASGDVKGGWFRRGRQRSGDVEVRTKP